jgi:hypothetical protein
VNERTKVQLDITGYAEGTGRELSRDLVEWLSRDRELSGEIVAEASGEEPDIFPLTVEFPRPPKTALLALSNALVAWLTARPRSSISIRISTYERSIELRSGRASWETSYEAVRAILETVTASGSETAFQRSSSKRGLRDNSSSEIMAGTAGNLADPNGQRAEFSLTDEEAHASTVPITIYLSHEETHGQVQSAIEVLLASAGLQIESRDDPIIGSWFRRMRATVKEAAHSPAAREATLTAAHMADTRLVLAHDATVTATLLQNLGPVLGALQPTKDAVIRTGALLIVKTDWSVLVFQLTAAQQAILDHRPQLVRSPHEIITALNLTPEDIESGEHPELK